LQSPKKLLSDSLRGETKEAKKRRFPQAQSSIHLGGGHDEMGTKDRRALFDAVGTRWVGWQPQEQKAMYHRSRRSRGWETVFRAMSRRAKQVLLVADSSKVGMTSPAVICPVTDIDILITGDGASDDTVKAINVLMCTSSSYKCSDAGLAFPKGEGDSMCAAEAEEVEGEKYKPCRKAA
jgi:hypothetical protein